MDKNSEINFECGYLYDLPKANKFGVPELYFLSDYSPLCGAIVVYIHGVGTHPSRE